MSVRKLIDNEIWLEKRILKRLKKSSKHRNVVLICKDNGGRRQFLLRNRNSSKRNYVKKSQLPNLEEMYNVCLTNKTVEVIENNIKELEKLMNKIKDYDSESVSLTLPRAYCKLHESLENLKEWSGNDPQPFPQSENPKDRAGLKFRTSFGLMVRSKNEMLIAEALYVAGIQFLYEARLELVVNSGGQSESASYNTEIIYPDFTIFLPDGEMIYWEHLGMMDKKDYRERNITRLGYYFENGIYPPKNMIITVDGEKMPFDNSAVWRVIEGMILSRY